jgi:hypothetical protein
MDTTDASAGPNGPASKGASIFRTEDSHGRRTEIADLCDYRVQQGATETFFVAAKRGGQYYGADIQLDSNGALLTVEKLREHPISGGWWKRWSLFSGLSIKAVSVCCTSSSV